MSVRPIVINGDPMLHTKTAEVAEVTDEIRALVADMFDTMEAAQGVGLAANQVGVPLRIFVYDCPDETGVRRSGHVINPVLDSSARPEGMPDPDQDLEGCLSVPGEAFPTGRASWAKVVGIDLDGNPVDVEGSGYFARCLQHESDHLDGILYLDRLVGRNRRDARRALKERNWARRFIVAWDPSVLDAADV